MKYYYILDRSLIEKTGNILCYYKKEEIPDEEYLKMLETVHNTVLIIYNAERLPTKLKIINDECVEDVLEVTEEHNVESIRSVEPVYSEELNEGIAFYLDRLSLDNYIPVIITTLNRRILNYKEIIPNAIEYIGSTLPEFLKVEDEVVIEPSKEELLKAKLYSLKENEVVVNNKIVELKSGQFIEESTIKSKVIPNKLLSYIWDFKKSDWIRVNSDAYELNKLQDIIVALQNKKLALQSLGFVTDTIDREIHYATETHKILAENVANLINNKEMNKQQ